ncbi:hypothetical protein ACFORL_00240 [Legionella dresdenensis]|uniref:Ankyrin repeats (3 copies) n=1 Tax=Legionella dresdenensis TaxID=450200 RepID=A0ABV8CB22_9GAMM
MPNLLPVSDFEQKLVFAGVAAGAIYFFFGPVPLAATITTLLLKKKYDNRRLNELIKRAIEAENSSDFLELEKKQVHLNEKQKLTMLINAHQIGNNALINHLYEKNFKVDCVSICTIFRQNQNLSLFMLLLKRFLSKYPKPSKQDLGYILSHLCIYKAFHHIDTLFLLYPEQVLTNLFEFFEQNNANGSAILQFLEERKGWLVENLQMVNRAVRCRTDEQLLNLLMAIFPHGELDLKGTLMRLIEKQINNESLYNNFFIYFNKKEKTEEFYSQLEQIVENALSRKKLDIAGRLFKDNPAFLTTRKEFAAKLLFRFYHKPKITKLLIKFGANTNITNRDGVSLLEQSIGSRYTLTSKKQRRLDVYMENGGDLSLSLRDAPQKRTDMTLLGYLPFLNLRVNHHEAFKAIRLQKFIALFLEIPGISFSNGTVCKHADMQDPQAYWNFLLDLYFKRNIANALKIDLPSSMVNQLNTRLTSLYSENGDYNPESLYEEYNQGKPVILPIYIYDGFGSSHIAVTGFVKTGPNSHIVVEADRGLGRHDFSVFENPAFSFYEFCKYTKTRHAPILVDKWQSHETKALLNIDLDAQKDNFCPSISAKFAFNITFFLCLIHQRIHENSQFNSNLLLKKEILTASYEKAALCMKEFSDLALNTMLNDYQTLQTKFINSDFLEVVEAIRNEQPPVKLAI